ncbi:hypothetical protein B7463_g1047, partial [Scytalidium lignicola]
MARPFASTFEKDRASPLTPAPAVPATPSSAYKTNVNRQKTRKWIEAKSVDYGGDDWGDEDDYYDEPPPPPPPTSKPSGLRQKGQGLQSPVNPESPGAGSSKKSYGDLPPVPPVETGGPALHRTNSFDAGDEKRSFSSATPLQSAGPATRFSQITGIPSQRIVTGPPALSISTQQPPQFAQPPHPSVRKQVASPPATVGLPAILQPGMSPVSATTQSSIDYQTRRDYSPSAAIPPLNARMSPPPVTMRSSPTPQNASRDSPAGARFPTRKSSLSQSDFQDVTKQRQDIGAPKPWTGGPPRSSSPGGAIRSPMQDSGAAKPWTAGQPSSPSSASRSPGGPAKATPFVRPSDIYRRVEVEREKERQSMESGRPSMDSLLGAKASDSSASPANPILQEPTAPDNSGYGARRIASLEVDDSGRRLQPFLEPVKERKSEYGFDGVDITSQMPSKGQESNLAPSLYTGLTSPVDPVGVRTQSVSPKLPDLKRMSGFGLDLDLFSSLKKADKSEVPTSASALEATSTPTIATNLGGQTTEDLTLHKEPSLGFTSIVHQAFDRNSDSSSIPVSPASRTGSGYRRSDTESTSGISPIMSRGSSIAIPETRSRDTVPPSIPEGIEEHISPPAETKAEQVGDSVADVRALPTATDFEPGHRRDTSLPSPGNSPAKIAGVSNPEVSPESHQAVVTNDTESEISRKDTPVSEVSRIQGDQDHELSPTISATENSQSQDSTENVIDEIIDEGVPRALSTSQSPEQFLPTPDPAMAPSGNIYSQPVDPRVTSGAQNVSADAQLPPASTDRDTSSGSSTAPLPPPKDTSINEAKDVRPGSLSSATDQLAPEESHESPGLYALPDSSADTRSQAEENDRLRNEIVQSLGAPEPSDMVRRHDSYLYDDSSPSGHARESTYLPSEYDNYWATTAEEAEPVPQLPSPTRIPAEAPNPVHQEPQSPFKEQPLPEQHPESPSVPPLEVRKSVVLESLPQQPALEHRFSWEKRLNLPPLRAELQSSAEPAVDAEDKQATGPQDQVEVSSQPMSVAENPSQSGLEVLEDNSKYHPDVTPAEGRSPSEPKPVSDSGLGSGAEMLAGATMLAGGVAPAYDPTAEHRLSLAEMKDIILSDSYPTSTGPPEDQHPAFAPHLDQSSQPEPQNPVSPTIVLPQPVKIMPFKDIASMSSPYQRIQTYEQTRQQFAAMDTGLANWVIMIKSLHAEHSNATGSYAGSGGDKFLKPISGSQQGLQQPYYQQYLNASSPTAPTSTNTARLSGSSSNPNAPLQSYSFSPAGSKLTSHEVQAKGKELLHAAGVFGGKAGKAGKGLLAKGKNRFRSSGSGDKINSNSTPTQQPSKPHQAEHKPPLAPEPKSKSRRSWALLSKSSSKAQDDIPAQQSREITPLPEPRFVHERSASLDSTTSRSSFLPPPTGLFGRRRRASSQLSREVSLTPQAQGQAGPSNSTLSREVLPQGNNNPPPPSSQTKAGLVVETQAKKEPVEHQDDLGIPAPIGKDQPSFDPYNTTPITEEDIFSHSRPISHFPEDPEKGQIPRSEEEAAPKKEELSEPVSPNTSISRDEPTNDDAVASNLDDVNGEQQANNRVSEDWVMVDEKEGLKGPPSVPSPPSPVSPMPTPPPVISDFDVDADEKLTAVKGHTRGRSSISIMDRARGSYDFVENDEPRSLSGSVLPVPALPKVSAPSSVRSLASGIPGPELFSPPNPPYDGAGQSSDVGSMPSRVQQLQSELQPTRKSSFKGLPPIRRSTSFGLGLDVLGDGEVNTTDPEHPAKQQEESVPRRDQNENRNAGPTLESGQEYTNAPGPAQGTPPRSSAARPPPSFVPFNDGLRQNNSNPNAPFSTNRWGETAARWNETAPSHARTASGPQQGYAPSTSSPLNERAQRGVSMPVQPRPFEQPPSSAGRYPDLFRQGNNQGQQVAPGDEMPDHYYQAPISPGDAILPRQTSEYQLPGVGPPTEDPQYSNSRRNSGFFRDIGGRIRAASRERARSRSRSRGEAAFSPPMSPGRPSVNEYADSVDSSDIQEKRKRRSGLFGSINMTRLSTPGSAPPRSRESLVGHHPGSVSNMLTTSPTTQTGKGEQGRLRSLFKREESSSSQQAKSKPNKLSRASTGASGLLDDGKKKTRFSSLGGVFGKSSRASWKESASEGGQSVAGDVSSIDRRSSMPLQASTFQQDSRGRNPPAQAPTAMASVAENGASVSQKRGLLSKKQAINSGPPESQPRQPSRPRQSSRTRRPSGPGILSGFLGRRSNQLERDVEPAVVEQSPQMQMPPQQPQQPFQPIHLSQRSQEPHGHRPPQQLFDPRIQQQTPRPQDIYPPGQYNGKQLQSLAPHNSQRSFQSQQYSSPRVQQDPRIPMQNMTPQNEREIPWQDQSDPQLERGRQPMRGPVPEPIYESVPIPGGYSLVHSQGGMVVPSAYDPRAPNYHAPQQYINPPYQYQYPQPSPQGPHQQLPGYISSTSQGYDPLTQSPQPQMPFSPNDQRAYRSSQNPLTLQPVDSIQPLQERRSKRALSREDLIARSPARETHGQQRPYQITLPVGADDDDENEQFEVQRAAASSQHQSSPTSLSPSQRNMLNNPPLLQPLGIPAQVQKLNQPIIRHPQSPAGYPLPESTFSPINPSAANFPPPPLPISPPTQHSTPSSASTRNPAVSRVSQLQPKPRHPTDLDRSDTGRTTVSGVSNISRDPFEVSEQEDSLALPSEKDLERGLSPTPPSFHLTPDRGMTPDTAPRTQIVRAPSTNSDLYNATPRETKPPEYTIQDENQGVADIVAAPQITRRRSQEEKIPITSGEEEGSGGYGYGNGNGNGGRVQEEEESHATMSATSYPGQEWNPFMNGYDDGLE